MNDAEAMLRAGLAALGYPADHIAPRLLQFARLVLEANATTNLVGSKSMEDLVAPHLLDGLAPLAHESVTGQTVDVGSGAGLPAIPIAVAYPLVSMTMLEPRAKRFAFLRSAIDSLELSNASARKMTAETAGRSDLRESADLVTVRAVAKPVTALELGAPLVMVDGRLLLYIGKQPMPSDHETEVAARLGLLLEKAKAIEVPYLQGVRHAWWFKKKHRTPSAYPRRAKAPSREPL